MNLYLKGKVISITEKYLIFESNESGYLLQVPNSIHFDIENTKQIFTYHYQNMYTNTLFGFPNYKDRVLFEQLINIPGIGPKIALTLLINGHKPIVELISENNSKGLMEYPYLSLRLANLIIYQLSNYYEQLYLKSPKEGNITKPIQIIDSLEILGFNKKEINFAIENLTPKETIEQSVEEAIKLIANARRLEN